jgi:hypothetical protein
MTEPNSTIKKLSEITNVGLFERLATEVLRACKPSLYESLSHPGVNTDGKTVKAPLDGIGWMRDVSYVSSRLIIKQKSIGCCSVLAVMIWLH